MPEAALAVYGVSDGMEADAVAVRTPRGMQKLEKTEQTAEDLGSQWRPAMANVA